jgi:hypothetical protein
MTRLEVDASKRARPLPRYIALQFEKFVLAPAANRFCFWAMLENNALLVAKLNVPAAGQYCPAVHDLPH